MERNYDLAHALVSCAVPYQNAISVLKTTPTQSALIENYLCKNTFNNLLVIENRDKGSFYGNEIMCDKFNRLFLNKKSHISYVSAKMWSLHFDIDNDSEFLQKINAALCDKKFCLPNNSIKNMQLYNDIANVCQYLQEDLSKFGLENSHIAKIWYQIIVNAAAILKLLKDTHFELKKCSQETLVKLIKDDLEMLERRSFYGIEKFEEDISYRKLFIPKLLYTLQQMA